MSTNLYYSQNTLDLFWNCEQQLFPSFSTAQITQIKQKSFLRKPVISKKFYWTKNSGTIVELFLFTLNDLNDNWNALVIESEIEYFTATGKFIAPLLWTHLSKSPFFLKTIIDSGSPYFIFFSCLVVKNFHVFIYFICLVECLSSRLRCM